MGHQTWIALVFSASLLPACKARTKYMTGPEMAALPTTVRADELEQYALTCNWTEGGKRADEETVIAEAKVPMRRKAPSGDSDNLVVTLVGPSFKVGCFIPNSLAAEAAQWEVGKDVHVKGHLRNCRRGDVYLNPCVPWH